MIALDTNILAYAISEDDPLGRHKAALSLLAHVAPTGAIVPLPVFGEFFNACRKKKLTTADVIISRVELWMSVFECPPAASDDYLMASVIAERFKLQYFDALIVAVVKRAGATMLLSEDMHDGLEIEGLKIVNPFAAANETLLADYFGSAL